MQVISVKNLCKSFGKLEVLKNINEEFAAGEHVVIIGPSGSGKSTLLRCINLLERPTSGDIIVRGENILDKSCDINRVRQKMGMVFQHFNLFENLTVMQNLTLAPIKLKVMNKEQAHEKALDLLKRVGLAGKADEYPVKLSGGQKQRVAIARALALEPDIMLFDEPTSALDPEMVGEVLEIMRRLAKSGMTMLIVTHEMGFAREVGSRIMFMDEGEVLEQNTPAEFFGCPQNERAREFLSKVL